MMRAFARTTITLIAGLMYAQPAAGSPNYQALNEAVINQQIVPAYKSFASTTRALNQSAQNFCEERSDKRLERVQAVVQDAWHAWAAAQHTRFGPIQFLTRSVRIQFWPDRRGKTSKHLNALVAREDAADLEPVKFSKTSVAVQGFPALERLLFTGEPTAPGFEFRCSVVLAIAGNLETIAANLLRDWLSEATAYEKKALSPGLENPFFPAAKNVSAVILKDISTALEFVTSAKLDRALGDDPTATNHKRLEAWRSEQSGALIAINLEVLVQILKLIDGEVEQVDLSGDISALQSARSQIGSIPSSLSAYSVTEDGHAALSDLSARLKQTRVELMEKLLPALDLTLGFNSLDGD